MTFKDDSIIDYFLMYIPAYSIPYIKQTVLPAINAAALAGDPDYGPLTFSRHFFHHFSGITPHISANMGKNA